MIPSKKKKVHQRVHHYTLSTTNNRLHGYTSGIRTGTGRIRMALRAQEQVSVLEDPGLWKSVGQSPQDGECRENYESA